MDISLKDITVRVPNQTLLTTDIVLSYGNTYCIVGKNGSGKTTLLKQLVDKTIPLPKIIDTFYVEQEMTMDLEKSVYTVVAESNRDKLLLQKRMSELLEIDLTDETLDEFCKINDELSRLDVNRDESVIRKILHGMGFSRREQDLPLAKFSGGWRMRANIARGVYMKPMLLLMDEPTNHLDFEASAWLSRELSTYPHTLVVVSHDRNFINSIADCVVELDTFTKTLVYYYGDYERYETEREKRYLAQIRAWEKNRSAIISAKKHGKSVPKELPKPPRRYIPRIRPPEIPIARGNVIEMRNCSVKFDERTIISNINLELGPRARVALVGKNGSGKTTFLRLLARDLEPTGGEIEFNLNGHIGYYAQHIADHLPRNFSPVQFIQAHRNVKLELIREALGVLGLPSATHLQLIGTLSGGQHARVLLAALMIHTPRLLVLDEPTNHLDLETVNALVEFMLHYNGVIVASTHNIDLIARADFTILEIENGNVQQTTLKNYTEKILDACDELD